MSLFQETTATHTPGIISDADPTGFLSFIRLVGCAYFRKHKAVFLPSFPTPATLFNSLIQTGQEVTSHHSAWLALIREKIWVRIKYEEEMIPSDEALKRHWKRACWVQRVWSQAASNNITYPSLEDSGWKLLDSTSLAIDWDSGDNITLIRDRVALIKKGCGCKTGCQTTRCKCKRGSHYCGPGCKCQGCINLPVPQTSVVTLDQDSSSESEVDFDEEIQTIMQEVFGGDLQETTEENEDMEMD